MSQEPQIKYIERIQISNFWGMYDVDWTLDKDVNILIGKNGSGKSTLKHSILRLLLNGKNQNRHRQVFRAMFSRTSIAKQSARGRKNTAR